MTIVSLYFCGFVLLVFGQRGFVLFISRIKVLKIFSFKVFFFNFVTAHISKKKQNNKITKKMSMSRLWDHFGSNFFQSCLFHIFWIQQVLNRIVDEHFEQQYNLIFFLFSLNYPIEINLMLHTHTHTKNIAQTKFLCHWSLVFF